MPGEVKSRSREQATTNKRLADQAASPPIGEAHSSLVFAYVGYVLALERAAREDLL